MDDGIYLLIKTSNRYFKQFISTRNKTSSKLKKAEKIWVLLIIFKILFHKSEENVEDLLAIIEGTENKQKNYNY